MVLISEVIMVVTTLVTLCQSAPARKGTKVKQDQHRHNADDASSIIKNSSEPYRFNDDWSSDHQVPGQGPSTVVHGEELPHSTRRNHESRRRHHKHHNQQQESENQNQNSRGRYEHLCETTMRTVHLNTHTEEYNPPFYVEVRCSQPQQTHSYSTVQKCAFNLLHCVQTYSTLNFSRRKADGTDCWQPFTLDIPSGCECMWPIEEFGPLTRHDDL